MNRAILVKSCHRFQCRFQMCELTWLHELRMQGVKAWVVNGGFEKPYLGPWLACVTCGDTYQDNSIKLREAIRLILAANDFTHIFIADDDTFVHPARWLAHEPAGDLQCRIYRPEDKSRNGGRPWIHGGGGWWMSRRLCGLYARECHERTSADDVIVARVAARHGIEMIDRPDLYGGDRYSGHNDRVAADNALITCHHVEPAEMHTLYETLCLPGEATRGL